MPKKKKEIDKKPWIAAGVEWHEWRSCTRKMEYKKLSHAWAVAELRPIELAPYRCKYCDKYHLSKTKRKAE